MASGSGGVYLDEEDAQKLQQGIETVSSILSITRLNPPEDETNAGPGRF